MVPKSASTPQPLPNVQHLRLADLDACLRAGLTDFLRAPAFGVLMSAFYVCGGLVLLWAAGSAGRAGWLIPFIAGFPLLAPFAAVGLYEVSRRIEGGRPLIWREVLGVVFAQKDRRIPTMAKIILLLFALWLLAAYALFALFLGWRSPVGVLAAPELLLQGNGPAMLLLGCVIGACFAAVLFAITVAGLPLLLEHAVEPGAAIGLSLRAVLANAAVLAVWGVIIATALLLGMLPMFLGLIVVLPVLGHASWHLYRRLLAD